MEVRFPLILDGATGTELQKRGYQGDVSAEQWVLEHPEVIVELQRGYVDAGSQVVYAPTFGANRQKLEEHRIFNRVEDYNVRLTALSRQAAAGRAWVAGDLSPTGQFLAPLGGASFEELVDIYRAGRRFGEGRSGPIRCGDHDDPVGRPGGGAGYPQCQQQTDLGVLHL